MTQADRPLLRIVLDAILRSAPVIVFAYDRDGTCTFSEGWAPTLIQYLMRVAASVTRLSLLVSIGS